MKVKDLAAKLALMDWNSEICIKCYDTFYDIDRIFKSGEYHDHNEQETVIELTEF